MLASDSAPGAGFCSRLDPARRADARRHRDATQEQLPRTLAARLSAEKAKERPENRRYAARASGSICSARRHRCRSRPPYPAEAGDRRRSSRLPAASLRPSAPRLYRLDDDLAANRRAPAARRDAGALHDDSPVPRSGLYLASGEWRGKAGGYTIQGLAGAFVVRLIGSYTSVVGCPVTSDGTACRGGNSPSISPGSMPPEASSAPQIKQAPACPLCGKPAGRIIARSARSAAPISISTAGSAASMPFQRRHGQKTKMKMGRSRASKRRLTSPGRGCNDHRSSLNNSRSQRVLWLLEELGVPYEIKHYQRDKKTCWRRRNCVHVHPLGKSPVITDDWQDDRQIRRDRRISR